MNFKKVTKQITPTLIGVAGGVGANFAATKITFITNPKLKYGAMLLAGLMIGSMKGEMMKNLGTGIATVSGMKLVGTFVPSLAGVTGVSDDVLNGVFDEVLEGVDDYDSVSGDDDMNGLGDDVLNGVGDDDEQV